MHSNRNIMLLIVVAAVAVSAGLWLGQRQFIAPDRSAAPAVQAALLYPVPRVIEPFALDRAPGGTFTAADFEGRWTLAFFGFTHCPDICPTTLAQLKQVEDALATPPLPDPLQLLFVSVDPARDDPATLARYAAYFSPSIIAATAPDERLQPMARGLGIVYLQTPLDGGGYTVDHSGQVVIVDPQGRLAGMFRPPLDPSRIAADLRRLAEAGA
ncbi:MAG: SCO family protein [Pseudomonadota bacterium]|jgi:protein SCO1/2